MDRFEDQDSQCASLSNVYTIIAKTRNSRSMDEAIFPNHHENRTTHKVFYISCRNVSMLIGCHMKKPTCCFDKIVALGKSVKIL